MPPSVLIVDDHPTSRRFARRLLEDEGFVVLGEADDGVRRRSMLSVTLSQEVVLLDIMLPDVSGLELAEVLGRGSTSADGGADLEPWRL